MFLLHTIARLRDRALPQGMIGHLESLRRTLIAMMLVSAVAFGICFCYTPRLMELLQIPVAQVWREHEAAHLPCDIAVQDWERAKEFAARQALLSPQAKSLLQERLSPSAIKLAQVVPMLQALQLLPAEDRRAALLAATSGTQRELALRLYDAGALLHTGQTGDSVRLMGVFRPAEAFLIAINISMIAGLILSFPILLCLLLRFILPGLHPHERVLLRRALFVGTLLFLGGCAFAYVGVLPRVLRFFFSYAQELGIENDWRIGYYLSFTAKLVLLFGAVFELPVILFPLIRLGLLHYDLMKRTRGYAFLLCLALALLLAPAPDPGTMLLLALPLYALYELCILFARCEAQRKERKAKPL